MLEETTPYYSVLSGLQCALAYIAPCIYRAAVNGIALLHNPFHSPSVDLDTTLTRSSLMRIKRGCIVLFHSYCR